MSAKEFLSQVSFFNNLLENTRSLKNMKKKIPSFKTEDEEREFWSTHDSCDYVDWSKAEVAIFPNLKPSLKTISLRLPEEMINELKVLANQRDVPYQSLMKILLAEKIQEMKRKKSSMRHPTF